MTDEPLNSAMTFRVTTEEREQYEDAWRSAGDASLSAYVRRLIREDTEHRKDHP